MPELTEIKDSVKSAADGFKQMQIALLIFAGLSAIGLLVASIAIFNK